MNGFRWVHADSCWIGWVGTCYERRSELPPDGVEVSADQFPPGTIEWAMASLPLDPPAPPSRAPARDWRATAAAARAAAKAQLSDPELRARASQVTTTTRAGLAPVVDSASRAGKSAATTAREKAAPVTEKAAGRARETARAAEAAGVQASAAAQPHVTRAAAATIRTTATATQATASARAVRAGTRAAVASDRAGFRAAGGLVPRTTWTLWGLLGALGAHRFYAHGARSGLLRLATTIGALAVATVSVVRVATQGRGLYVDATGTGAATLEAVIDEPTVERLWAGVGLLQDYYDRVGQLPGVAQTAVTVSVACLCVIVILWAIDAFLVARWLHTRNATALAVVGTDDAAPLDVELIAPDPEEA